MLKEPCVRRVTSLDPGTDSTVRAAWWSLARRASLIPHLLPNQLGCLYHHKVTQSLPLFHLRSKRCGAKILLGSTTFRAGVVGFLFDGVNVTPQPLTLLAPSKSLPLRTGGGGGVVSHSDTVVPAQIQNRVV